jgi:hypothetical protein
MLNEAGKLSRCIGFILLVKARVRVRQRLEMLHVPAGCEMMIIDQKEKRVRADKSLVVFARLAFTSPAKTMTNNLPILSVLAKEPVIFSEYLVVKVHELFTF